GVNTTGKAWIGKNTDAITGVSVDIGKQANPLTLWAMEVKYTIPELESSMLLGKGIDTAKYDGMNLKHDMDIDEQVYVGDTTLNQKGLINSPLVTANNAVLNTGGTSTHWASKSPDEILADVNTLLNTVWAASGWQVMPSRLLIPPVQYGILVSTKVSTAG